MWLTRLELLNASHGVCLWSIPPRAYLVLLSMEYCAAAPQVHRTWDTACKFCQLPQSKKHSILLETDSLVKRYLTVSSKTATYPCSSRSTESWPPGSKYRVSQWELIGEIPRGRWGLLNQSFHLPHPASAVQRESQIGNRDARQGLLRRLLEGGGLAGQHMGIKKREKKKESTSALTSKPPSLLTSRGHGWHLRGLTAKQRRFRHAF